MPETRSNCCSQCNSTQVYIRLKTSERVCRKCGNIDSLKKEEIKDGAPE